jgi:hypothetical protein
MKVGAPVFGLNTQGEVMGRIRSDILINGHKRWALYDSGARHSYIVDDAAATLDVKDLPVQRTTALGGKTHTVRQVCLVFADVDGHPLDFEANVVDEIGSDEDGRRIEVLFGALAMQAWGLQLDPQNERIDWSHFSTDLVEF